MNTQRSRRAGLISVAAATLVMMLIALTGPLPPALAQETPTPEPTAVPHVVAYDVGGQYVLIDYTITAGDFFIGSVLTFLVLLDVLLLVVFAYRKRYQ